MIPAGCVIAAVGYLRHRARRSPDGGTGGLVLPRGAVRRRVRAGHGRQPDPDRRPLEGPPQDAPDASGVLTTVIQLGLVLGVATFGSVFLTQAAVPGPHPTADAMSETLWLIVARCLACAVAATVMVRAQPAQAAIALAATDEVAVPVDAA